MLFQNPVSFKAVSLVKFFEHGYFIHMDKPAAGLSQTHIHHHH
jgi:hypothetical protein